MNLKQQLSSFSSFRDHRVHTDRLDRHGQIDSASNPDQRFYFIWSKYNIPFIQIGQTEYVTIVCT